jgi:altronate dehydratase small subunit
MPQAAIVIDEKDNVATALGHLEAGATMQVEIGGQALDVALREPIPMGHKFALRNVEPGQPIIKYGEAIGVATKKILKGEHAHVHNVEGPKGRRHQE